MTHKERIEAAQQAIANALEDQQEAARAYAQAVVDAQQHMADVLAEWEASG